MSWKIAPALGTLRAQVNKALPKRSKRSDGVIGDARHKASVSDHNPNAHHIVCAWDITATPKEPIWKKLVADLLKDERTHYVVFNKRFYHRGRKSAAYHGVSPHTEHIHLSIRQDEKAWNDKKPWELPSLMKPAYHDADTPPAPPVVVTPPMEGPVWDGKSMPYNEDGSIRVSPQVIE